ncbi:MAG TPA: hypothetical protein VNM15_06210 [Candidatus Binatia bacterium]|nr:hypothetical protein [Candidatus Binatia bacterium]
MAKMSSKKVPVSTTFTSAVKINPRSLCVNTSHRPQLPDPAADEQLDQPTNVTDFRPTKQSGESLVWAASPKTKAWAGSRQIFSKKALLIAWSARENGGESRPSSSPRRGPFASKPPDSGGPLKPFWSRVSILPAFRSRPFSGD